MKNTIVTLLLVLLFASGFSQDLSYNVRGKYSRPINKENLDDVKLISDVISGYPKNWITSYSSVEISAICNGNSVTAKSKNAKLTTEQKNSLRTVDLNTDLIIDVNYTYKVPVTNVVEHNTMHVPMTVIPEVEAEYIGGHQQLMDYLKENGIDKITGTTPAGFEQVTILFTINEEGAITDAKINKTSLDIIIDNTLLDIINAMPKWKPAQNAKGVKVKQQFEFSVYKGPGKAGC